LVRMVRGRKGEMRNVFGQLCGYAEIRGIQGAV
jgi:hypothetical protein